MALALITLCAAPAQKAPAHEEMVPYREWLVTRQRPDFPGPCCGAGPGTDQYYASKYEPNPAEPGGYLVWIDGFNKPAIVPPTRVIPEDVNPTGRGVIWMSTNWPNSSDHALIEPGVVFCFEPGTGL